MTKIIDYKLNYFDNNYDRKTNPNKLSVEELSPLGLTWFTKTNTYQINFNNKGSVCILKDSTGFGIIESRKESNDSGIAYILNSNNLKRFDIKLPNEFKNGIFYDVYYVKDNLCFFFYCGRDYRAIINENTGQIEDIIMSY